jgi:1,4-alpha-glucan branching enzyme
MDPREPLPKPSWADTDLFPYLGEIDLRSRHADARLAAILEEAGNLSAFARAHERFGLHRTPGGWRFAEWAPNAEAVFLVGDATGWREVEPFRLRRGEEGVWEGDFPAGSLHHGQHYKLAVHWPGGSGERIPAYARRVVQDAATDLFSAQVWEPAEAYAWRFPDPPAAAAPLVYEAHVGMAQEAERVGTYAEFRDRVLPRIADAGYNTLQLMAVLEHPYYGSFGYHVSSFFAPSSRFGTPEEFKSLVDAAHGLNLRVVIDLVHSHGVKNENEGLSRFDGTDFLYFHGGERGNHPLWDSRLFDYGKLPVLRFLLSNCRYWLEEYRVDGFRFDGVTSMLYTHHGAYTNFLSYADYFGPQVDFDAWAYLCLANRLVHEIRPGAITVAEDVSGMPGLCAPPEDAGCGFDFRMAMGVPDFWFRTIAETPDEAWDLRRMWWELTGRRPEEKVISYVESHDQALVGGKTIIFKLADAGMYGAMHERAGDLAVDRAVALHKLMRLVTLAASGGGYLNFMGNEFGHPEWVDFPREGNGWSYHYARRQWSLRDAPDLKYRFLGDFDRAMIRLFSSVPDRLGGSAPRRLALRPGDQVLVFERGGLFLLVNFHPDRSFVDYPLEMPVGGYRLVLDTDEPRFGGQGRLAPGQRYETDALLEGDTRKHTAHFYLPSRTALILEKDD